ncbi:CLIP-associating protein 2 [Ameca splendens]|uniref:CLIP-associating protein 2 n=1 Tax=Ameca splendens TaxID=208324 RepID=A0ABV0ZZT1_9TELE
MKEDVMGGGAELFSFCCRPCSPSPSDNVCVWVWEGGYVKGGALSHVCGMPWSLAVWLALPPSSHFSSCLPPSLSEPLHHVGYKEPRGAKDQSVSLARGGPITAEDKRLQTIFARFDEALNSGNMALSPSHDRSFDDDDSTDGRSSSAQATFKVPKVPKKPVESSAARRPSATSGKLVSKESAGAVDEDDFIRAFTDVPTVQIYSTRDLEDNLNKIREILSDDKHDWDQRCNALKKIRSLLVAGAASYDCFYQHLRLLDGAFKLSAKDLRSQVVREACITVAHLSSVLGNKFDHGAEAIVPVLFNLIPNCAKVMATSGVSAIRIIIRHTHVPRLIPLITSNCTSKSVAVRRRCYVFLDHLLQEWQTHSLERHTAVLVESIKKGIRDADSEARVEARKTYWGLRNHFPAEADALYNSLEPSYQKTLQSCLKSSGSVASLPQSDRSSSSSQESLNRPLTSKWSAAPGRDEASDKTDGTRSDNGRVRTKQPLSTASTAPSQVDSRGRSRTKMVSQSQRSDESDCTPGILSVCRSVLVFVSHSGIGGPPATALILIKVFHIKNSVCVFSACCVSSLTLVW